MQLNCILYWGGASAVVATSLNTHLVNACGEGSNSRSTFSVPGLAANVHGWLALGGNGCAKHGQASLYWFSGLEEGGHGILAKGWPSPTYMQPVDVAPLGGAHLRVCIQDA